MAPKKKTALYSALSKLRKNLFASSESNVPKKKVPEQKPKATPKPKSNAKAMKPQREAYYIQIGFDFGTSFSKCIIRDIGFDRAKVFVPAKPADEALPFLLPTTLRLHGIKLSTAPANGNSYGRHCLPFIKMALASTAQGSLRATCLTPYQTACDAKGWRLNDFVMAGAVFYLAELFGEIDEHIKKEFPGFGEMEGDQQFINVAIPIFQKSNRNIEIAFNKAVKIAWEVRHVLRDRKRVEVSELMKLVSEYQDAKNKTVEDGAPFLYPEISAGLQVYAKSNAFPEGIYLFSDTGAGTVDQAVFTYHKNGFSFLEAMVSPLGSSEIEAFASQHSKRDIEELRCMKENGEKNDNALDLARCHLARRVQQKTTQLVSDTMQYKLYLKDQMQKSTLLFSGGGHCLFPYEVGVQDVFKGRPLFKKKVHPKKYGMLDLHDLEFPWNADRDKWINRLHVAYGLSFPDYELEKVKLPDEISDASQRPMDSC